MKELITEAEKMEIVELYNNGHAPALVGFGADLCRIGYKKGLVHGSLAFAIGCGIGCGTYKIIQHCKKKFNFHKHKNSNVEEA